MKRLKTLLAIVATTMSLLIITSTGVIAEWKSNSSGWWYAQENSYATGWKQIDKVWYSFDDNGYMKKGWIYDNGTWYYSNLEGAMQTGIIQVDGKTYYLSINGSMQTGNVIIGEDTYSFAISGEAIGDKIPQATKAFSREGIATTPNQIQETLDNNHKIVEISLPESPSAGYKWEYKIDVDGIIKEDSYQYKPDNTDIEVVGGGGTGTWKFSALKEGTVEVIFKYKHVWETESSETKTYIFTVDKELKITVNEK